MGELPKTPMLEELNASGSMTEKVYTPQRSPPAEGPTSPPG